MVVVAADRSARARTDGAARQRYTASGTARKIHAVTRGHASLADVRDQKRMTQVLYRGTLDVAFGGVAKDHYHCFVCVVAYTSYLSNVYTERDVSRPDNSRSS